MTLPLFLSPWRRGADLADKKKQKFYYGGQAIIEGVMMRGPKDYAVAVRRANGEIEYTKEDVESIMGRFKWLNKPILRGTLALIDSMALGIKALKYSADKAMADAVEEDSKNSGECECHSENTEKNSGNGSTYVKDTNSKINDYTVGIMMVLGMALGIAVFMMVPILIVKPLRHIIHAGWELTAIEGIIKIAIFVGYVALISMMKDIKRVFQYHGAEHKTINTYEAGVPLTVENAKKYTRIHVRCGTSFILIVLITSIIVFMLVADHLPYGSLSNAHTISYFMRFLYKIILLPVVAGIAYEIIKFAGGRKQSFLTKLLLSPGLLMQKITTREPEPEMLEVAIKSLECVLENEDVRSNADTSEA